MSVIQMAMKWHVYAKMPSVAEINYLCCTQMENIVTHNALFLCTI